MDAPSPGHKSGTGGSYYGPYFVAHWTTGRKATHTTRARSTFYYTLDNFYPYGQVILKRTVVGGLAPKPPKPPPPRCKGTTCM